MFVHKILLQSRRFVHYYFLLLICLSNLPRLNNVRQQKLLIFIILRCFSQHPLQIYTENQLVTSCHTFRHKGQGFYVFVDRASRYIRVMKTNLLHYLSSIYFVIQPLHVLGIFVAHHQEVYSIYTTTGTGCSFQVTVCWPANIQSTKKHNTYQLYIYSIPPDDGLKIWPKHAEVD